MYFKAFLALAELPLFFNLRFISLFCRDFHGTFTWHFYVIVPLKSTLVGFSDKTFGETTRKPAPFPRCSSLTIGSPDAWLHYDKKQKLKSFVQHENERSISEHYQQRVFERKLRVLQSLCHCAEKTAPWIEDKLSSVSYFWSACKGMITSLIVCNL